MVMRIIAFSLSCLKGVRKAERVLEMKKGVWGRAGGILRAPFTKRERGAAVPSNPGTGFAARPLGELEMCSWELGQWGHSSDG